MRLGRTFVVSKILVRHGDLLVVCGPQRAVTRVLRPALPRGGSGQSCARSSARVRGCTRSVCRYYHSHESVGIEYTHFLGTHSPSLALECKCAFGAKINFQIKIFSWINVRLRRTFVVPKSLCVTVTYWWIVVHSTPRRECCGLRSLAVGPGKAVLAPQLV